MFKAYGAVIKVEDIWPALKATPLLRWMGGEPHLNSTAAPTSTTYSRPTSDTLDRRYTKALWILLVAPDPPIIKQCSEISRKPATAAFLAPLPSRLRDLADTNLLPSGAVSTTSTKKFPCTSGNLDWRLILLPDSVTRKVKEVLPADAVSADVDPHRTDVS